MSALRDRIERARADHYPSDLPRLLEDTRRQLAAANDQIKRLEAERDGLRHEASVLRVQLREADGAARQMSSWSGVPPMAARLADVLRDETLPEVTRIGIRDTVALVLALARRGAAA